MNDLSCDGESDIVCSSNLMCGNCIVNESHICSQWLATNYNQMIEYMVSKFPENFI